MHRSSLSRTVREYQDQKIIGLAQSGQFWRGTTTSRPAAVYSSTLREVGHTMAVVANTALGPSQQGPHSDGRGPSLKGPAIVAAVAVRGAFDVPVDDSLAPYVTAKSGRQHLPHRLARRTPAPLGSV